MHFTNQMYKNGSNKMFSQFTEWISHFVCYKSKAWKNKINEPQFFRIAQI